MRLGAFFRRLDRGLGRFNQRFGGAAAASNAEQSGAGASPAIDPARVAILLGEIEAKGRPDGEERETNRT
jgi:hypothetical protein